MGAALPVAALALTAVGTGVAVAGTVQQAQAANAQAKYQSQVAKNNAIIAEQAATASRERGRIEELQSRLRTQQQIGRSRASAAARGVQVGTGSALLIEQDIAQIGEYDALNIRQAAELEALGYTQQSTQFKSDAQMRRVAGKEQQKAGFIEAGSTLLSGGGTVADRWYQYKSRET